MKKRILSLLTIAFLISLIVAPLIVARVIYKAHEKELVKAAPIDTSNFITEHSELQPLKP